MLLPDDPVFSEAEEADLFPALPEAPVLLRSEEEEDDDEDAVISPLVVSSSSCESISKEPVLDPVLPVLPAEDDAEPVFFFDSWLSFLDLVAIDVLLFLVMNTG